MSAGGHDDPQLRERETGLHSETVAADGRPFSRIAIRTRWIEPGEDLADVAREYTDPIRESGDVLIVSEKVLAVALRNLIPAERLAPGRLAKRLSGVVGNTPGPGLNVPEKMQFVVDRAGVPRVLLAAAASALTRPLGISGVFHRIVGDWCRHIDGMCPPYERAVIPPLRNDAARQQAERLAAALGMPTAIIDLNDRGGTIRAASAGLDPDLLLSALDGNPLGQGERSTPLGLLRETRVPTKRQASG